MTDIEPSKVDFAELANLIIKQNGVARAKNNKASRVTEWNGSLETLPIDKAAQLVELVDTFLVQKFGSVLKTTEPRKLTGEELVALAQELEAAKTLSEVMASVNERAKELIFDHINVTHADDSDPEGADDNVLVPELGKRFRRSGAGFGEPTADWSRIEEVIEDPAALNRVAPEQFTLTLSANEYGYLMSRVNQNFRNKIKVESKRVVDKDAVIDYVVGDDELEAKFAQILKPGSRRDGAFYFENTPKDK
jgi:hypothetical protein